LEGELPVPRDLAPREPGMNDAATIHVIDDDEAVRCSMAALLAAHGYQSAQYALAREFLEQANLHSVGVVVADLIMPEMTGEQLQERMLALDSTLSLVMVSGMADVKTAIRVIQRGALTLLEKPFAQEELFAALAAGITRSRLRVEQRSQAAATASTLNTLSPDERALLKHLLTGATIESNSEALNTCVKEVERRVRGLLNLFGVASIGELAILVDKTPFKDH